MSDNTWSKLTTDTSLNTGKVNRELVWPKFSLGQTMVAYYDYLVLFGGYNSASPGGAVANSQSLYKQLYDKSGLWIFDTII